MRESESLRRILNGDGWALDFVRSFPAAEAALRAISFGVVICPGHLEDGCGRKDAPTEIQQMPITPQLIVADRLADEALWRKHSTLAAAIC